MEEVETQCSPTTTDNPLNPTHSPDQHSRFYVHFLSKDKRLKNKHFQSLDDFKRAAFQLYEAAEFNDNNAILTYFTSNNEEVLLTAVPDRSHDSYAEYQHLFIQHVRNASLDQI